MIESDFRGPAIPELYAIPAMMFARKGWTVLDVGCGVGHGLRAFEDHGLPAGGGLWIGLDTDDRCIDWLRDQNGGKRHVLLEHDDERAAERLNFDVAMVIDVPLSESQLEPIFDNANRYVIVAAPLDSEMPYFAGYQGVRIEMEKRALWVWSRGLTSTSS